MEMSGPGSLLMGIAVIHNVCMLECLGVTLYHWFNRVLCLWLYWFVVVKVRIWNLKVVSTLSLVAAMNIIKISCCVSVLKANFVCLIISVEWIKFSGLLEVNWIERLLTCSEDFLSVSSISKDRPLWVSVLLHNEIWNLYRKWKALQQQLIASAANKRN